MRFWVECVWNMLNLFPFLVGMMVCPEELRDAREDDTIKNNLFFIHVLIKQGPPHHGAAPQFPVLQGPGRMGFPFPRQHDMAEFI